METRINEIRIICFTIALCLFGCSSDESYEVEKVNPDEVHLSIGDVKSIYQGEDTSFGSDIDYIEGVVISQSSSNNLPNEFLVIQEGNSGLILDLGTSLANIKFMAGDSVRVKITDGSLVKSQGNLMINDLSISDVEKLNGNNEIEPTSVTLAQLEKDFEVYNSSLIRIQRVDIVPQPEPGDKLNGTYDLIDHTSDSRNVKLKIHSDSDLTNEEAFVTASYVGIPFMTEGTGGEGEYSVWPRESSDIVDESPEPTNTKVIITGIMPNPKGVDQKLKGDVTNYPSTGISVTHSGGYEYIQLMALEDIDFSETPYSVVFAREGVNKATDKGWAEGGKTTFKFDLTEGFAAQGTFFYVGSNAKRLVGYNSVHGESTDISHANWIRSLEVWTGDANDIAGDGFGNSTTALMANTSEGNGIAVFEGTDINTQSIPVDAVFYNPVSDLPLENDTYLMPEKSDLYSARDKNGNAQKYYGQGTNTFAVPRSIGDEDGNDARWAKMGGVVSENGWIVPRSPTIMNLSGNEDLSIIEEGSGVTEFRK